MQKRTSKAPDARTRTLHAAHAAKSTRSMHRRLASALAGALLVMAFAEALAERESGESP